MFDMTGEKRLGSFGGYPLYRDAEPEKTQTNDSLSEEARCQAFDLPEPWPHFR
jgi:hypothetical protein